MTRPPPVASVIFALGSVGHNIEAQSKHKSRLEFISKILLSLLLCRLFFCLIVSRLRRTHDELLLVLHHEVAVPAPQAQLPHMFDPRTLGQECSAGFQEGLGDER